ncbi:hypothetical protein [Streptomyces parvus]
MAGPRHAGFCPDRSMRDALVVTLLVQQAAVGLGLRLPRTVA